LALPRIQPITPTWRRDPFDDPDWLFDVKYDGFRALFYLERPGRSRLISRNGNVFSRFVALADRLTTVIDVDDAVLDGEIVATDDTGRPQFYDLLRGARAPTYVAFDLLWVNGVDLRSLPLRERRRGLQSLLPKASPIVTEAVAVERRGREL
jgi:bifunctional non-homologous end joining protein LigD